MTDYGQDLQFGTFITPDANEPERVVELALLTEAAGLELATFQDHPYQARFLDAWALIGAVAARTSTLRLTTNVSNLPLRPPFMLAKMVASLDQLSRGRIELGIGAGAFWDAVVAAGGPRRTPREAVTALTEGIDIIRATWDTTQRSVRVTGEVYRVVGVHPGPAPAHEVEIWIGAIGPKMLALTGQVGNGWLPSQAYVPIDQLAEKNALIDEAALVAGRNPAEVRRLYNVNPSDDRHWADQLAELTLTHGISTFIVTGDDPRVVQRFGTEIAPAVRELVAAERRLSDRGGPPDGVQFEDDVDDDTETHAAGVSVAGGRAAGGQAAGDRTAGDRTAADQPAEGGAEARRSAWPANAPQPTPDDGVRRSAEQPWRESARPTYTSTHQPLAWSNHERAAGQHLIDIHDHLRTELDQLFSLIGQVESGTLEAGRARSLINTMTLRQNDWALGAYCQSYCRVVTTHHSIEDTSMFPHLRNREPGLGPVIERLEQEHHIIAGVLDQVDRALVAVVSQPDGLDELRRAVDLLSDTMTSHLSYEERELVEPLARFGYY